MGSKQGDTSCDEKHLVRIKRYVSNGVGYIPNYNAYCIYCINTPVSVKKGEKRAAHLGVNEVEALEERRLNKRRFELG